MISLAQPFQYEYLFQKGIKTQENNSCQCNSDIIARVHSIIGKILQNENQNSKNDSCQCGNDIMARVYSIVGKILQNGIKLWQTIPINAATISWKEFIQSQEKYFRTESKLR